MSNQAHGGPSRTRIVHYEVESSRGDFSAEEETLAEDALCLAKASGVVTEYDVGRCGFLWFEGPPGLRMRALRRLIGEIVR